MKKLILLFILFGASAINLELKAQDFAYQPKNPAFGGSYLNYSWLLSSAQSQNTIEDPNQESRNSNDPMANFESNLNRQILNQLSRRIVESQFGEDGLEDGSYTLGNYQIEVGSDGGGVRINIFDSSTGNSTSVEVPYY